MNATLTLGWKETGAKSAPEVLYLGLDQVAARAAGKKAQQTGEYQLITLVVNPLGSRLPHVPMPTEEEAAA